MPINKRNKREKEISIEDIKKIKLLKNLTKDLFCSYFGINSFTVFKSINDILYLIYSNRQNSIIFYDLINNTKILEIKNAHNDNVNNFIYYNDIINKRDLILTVSKNNIKIWNVNNVECLLDIKNIYKDGEVLSCFLINNNQIHILTGNFIVGKETESIRIFDFKGNKEKEINNSKDTLLFIDSYYDKKLLNNYIITGNLQDCCKSFDYNKTKIYKEYKDYNYSRYGCCSLTLNNKEEIIKLIGACQDEIIRIWDFHSGNLLNKIEINKILRGICIWNKNYLFVGCDDNTIKIIDLKSKSIIKNLEGHKDLVITIKKIIHPLYGECLISQGVLNEGIKIWNIGN